MGRSLVWSCQTTFLPTEVHYPIISALTQARKRQQVNCLRQTTVVRSLTLVVLTFRSRLWFLLRICPSTFRSTSGKHIPCVYIGALPLIATVMQGLDHLACRLLLPDCFTKPACVLQNRIISFQNHASSESTCANRCAKFFSGYAAVTSSLIILVNLGYFASPRIGRDVVLYVIPSLCYRSCSPLHYCCCMKLPTDRKASYQQRVIMTGSSRTTLTRFHRSSVISPDFKAQY